MAVMSFVSIKSIRFAAIFHDIDWPAYGHGHFDCPRFAGNQKMTAAFCALDHFAEQVSRF